MQIGKIGEFSVEFECLFFKKDLEVIDLSLYL